MSSIAVSPVSMIDSIWPKTKQVDWLRTGVLLIAGSLLLTASAKLQIPFWPVPMTMQTFAVLVIGMAFGPVLGASTVALYLLEGAFGLPVFAGTPEKGLGLAYMMGPTGGYLMGFVIASGVMGALTRRGFDKKFGLTLLAMTIGTAIIFASGYTWLAVSIGAEKAWQFGVLPFLGGAVFKIALAAVVLPGLWKLLKKPSES